MSTDANVKLLYSFLLIDSKSFCIYTPVAKCFMMELSINLHHVLATGVHLWVFLKEPQSTSGKLFFQYGYSFKQKAL